MSSDLEARLLASLPDAETFLSLSERGVEESSFRHWPAIYHYIEMIVGEHGHLPRLIDLKATFNLPDHIRREPAEFSWLLEEFQRLGTAKKIQELVDRSVMVHAEDPQALITNLVQGLTSLSGTGQRGVSATDQKATARMSGYSATAKALDDKGLAIHGIPTGLSYFDLVQRIGWMPGELNGIVARPYMGKSWFAVWHGVLAWEAGFRVLFLSPEMPADEVEARFDAIVCGQRGVPVSVTEFYRGYYPSQAQKALAESVSKRSDWITIDTSAGRSFRLLELPRLLKQYAPDILIVDGLPLIGAENRGSALWEQMKDLAYGFKDLAQGAGVPILLTHQANRGANRTDKPPELHEIAFGDAVAQACDRVITISLVPKEAKRRRLSIQKYRKGESVAGGIEFEFDPEHGRIAEVEYGKLPSAATGSGIDGESFDEWGGNPSSVPIP